jgi:hypothetical protein
MAAPYGDGSKSNMINAENASEINLTPATMLRHPS